MDLFGAISRRVLYPSLVLAKRESHLARLRELEKTQYLAPETLRLLQFERLKALVQHAYAHCPFYTRRFSEYGVSPESLKEPADIGRLPILRKRDVQANLEDMVATDYPPSCLVKNQTAGSTGKPLVFCVDYEGMEARKAATFRHNRWAGYDIADRAALIWGPSAGTVSFRELRLWIRTVLSERSVFLDASRLSEDSMVEFARKLVRYRPRAMLAYASSAQLFASFVEEKGLAGISPRSVITTAEMLHPHWRQKIESVFGCRVFDRYGARETSVIASECDRHSGLHVNAEQLIVETLKDGRQTGPREPGEVVITSLVNWGMPFIRYAIEDVAAFSGSQCPCGRTLPLLEGLGGRVTDFIKTPGGRSVSGAALSVNVVAGIPGIAQAQIIQRELGSVTFRIVKRQAFSRESEELLRRKSREFLGDSVAIVLEFVDHIPSEPSGKFRFSISELT